MDIQIILQQMLMLFAMMVTGYFKIGRAHV